MTTCTCAPRVRLASELGITKTLPDGHVTLKAGTTSNYLILGLGPDPAALACSIPAGSTVRYIECPDFERQTSAEWKQAVPAEWIRLDQPAYVPGAHVRLYSYAARLFPSFWNPIIAALALPEPQRIPRLGDKTVIMRRDTGKLLVRELAWAFNAKGFHVEDQGERSLARLLRQGRPDLFFSVNFDGLDDYGQDFELLRRAGVPVAVWCVDNPFHALSRLKGPFWREAAIFVTDSWFIEPLKAQGARHVHHLPLAANQDFFRASPTDPSLAERMLFVGRSAFPCKDDFFAGLTPPQAAWTEAEAMMLAGKRPDFAWWLARLEISDCWPGKQARLAGLCAEECSRTLRALALTQAAGHMPLTIVGHDNWRDLIQAPFELRPLVDYYGPLAGLYASARFTLGATSPLLPHGLTQRHFDVWAAGGFLLSDATPGLKLFPEELTREIVYQAPADIPALAARLASDAKLRHDLSAAWREALLGGHTYVHRVDSVLERMAI